MNIIRSNIVLLFIFLVITEDSLTQIEADFVRITRNEGLSHNNVYSIIQDKFGFMWFGTQDGLNRYDGYTFKQFYHEPHNPNSLISSNFGKIIEDNDGYIWFGTHYNGLDRYNPLTNEFKHFVNNEEDESTLSSNHIRYLAKDLKGNIWIATSGSGLNQFNIRAQSFIRYLNNEKDSNSVSSNYVNAIVVDKLNNLWVGTNSGLDYYDQKSRNFKHYTIGYESFDQRLELPIRALLLDKNGILWIGTSSGLYTYNQKTKQYKHYKNNITDPNSLSDDLINVLYQDSYGNIWIGTEYGLNLYNQHTGNFVNYFYDAANLNSLSNNRIWSICEDRSNILWIGTKGGGVNKFDLKRKKFYNIAYRPNNKSSLSHPSISSAVADTSGNIWLGTDGGGICAFNVKKIKVNCFNQHISYNQRLSDDQIWSSCYGYGKLWLGTHTGGLNCIELVNNQYVVKRYKNTGDSTGISNNQVNCLMYDKDGFLWIGTRDGLSKLIDTSKTTPPYFLTFKKSYSDTNSLIDNYIISLYQDHQGFLWVGTYDSGLDKIDLSTWEVTHYQSYINNKNSISGNSINVIFEDHMGTIWIGTAGGGINKLEKNNNVFRQFHVQDGLASNEVMAILEDHSGYLWISTSKGLSKFNSINEKFINFDIADGLISDGFNRGAAYQDENGWMYFGTNAGLVYFHPSQIKLNSYIPDIIITRFTLLKDDNWYSKDLFISKYNAEQNVITLDYDKNIFSIEFAALDFTEPQNNIFQYKIDEINKDWIDYGTQRSIMVTNLDPGKYTLRIRGTNSDKVLNEEGITVSIVVQPPFWRTEGFFFILGVIIILIIISVYSFLVKLKTNKILALKNKELEDTNLKLIDSEKNLKLLNETKDKFFSIIAHDLRNPFNPLLALTELLDDDYKELDENERRDFIKEIRHGAKRLYDLLENLLHWALTQTKQIKFNQVSIDLGELVQNNIDLLKINAEKKDIALVKKFNGDFKVIADENMLNSIVRNLLNNAIKFSGEKTEISVNIDDEGENFRVAVKDQGIGIPPENIDTIFKGFSKSTIDNAKGKGSGLGLILCKEFVEKNGGEIWVESNPGEGSTFYFTLKKA